MNVLIVSDHFTNENIPEQGDDINTRCISWNDGKIKYAQSEFHVVIVDVSFSHSRANLDSIKGVYLDIENWLPKLIKSEGFILIVICGYEDKEIFDFDYVNEEENEDNQNYPGAFNTSASIHNRETEIRQKRTYAFISKIDENTYTLIDYVPEGSMFDPPVIPLFKEYFNNVEHFFITYPDMTDISIKPISKTQGIGNAYISFEKRLKNGFIVYLPGYNYLRKQDAFAALMNICKLYFEKQMNRLNDAQKKDFESDVPEWVNNYKIARHVDLPSEIQKLNEEKEFYEKICFLLYGKDPSLECSVKLVFEDLGMDVSKSPEGESFDLICNLKEESLEFFIEITGSNYSSGAKKVKQIMDFRYHFPDKKIILLVNSFCNLDLPERSKKESFPLKVINGLKPFDVLLLTTVDLYFLWKAVKEGDKKELEVLKLIQNSKGVFQYSKKKSNIGGG